MATFNVWNHWAKNYDKLLLLQNISLTPTRQDIIREITPLLEKEKNYKLLDMGCGTGQLIEEMSQHFKNYNISYTGVDLSPNMIEQARKRMPNIPFLLTSMDDFQAASKEYDFIVCAHSFPYYPDKKASLKKFYDMLKPGGYFFLVHGSVNTLYDRIILFFIKLGAWQGEYLSIKKMSKLLKEQNFNILKVFKVNKKFWIASISFFLSRKEK